MIMSEFSQLVKNELEKLEENPRFFVEVQRWNDRPDNNYTLGYYPRCAKLQSEKRFSCYSNVFNSPEELLMVLKHDVDIWLKHVTISEMCI